MSHVVWTFDVPPEVDPKVKSVDVKMLLVEEEKQAHKRSGGDDLTAAHELTKASIVGATMESGEYKKLSVGDGSIDTFWKEATAPFRELMAVAFFEVNRTTKATQESFVKTKKMKVA